MVGMNYTPEKNRHTVQQYIASAILVKYALTYSNHHVLSSSGILAAS